MAQGPVIGVIGAGEAPSDVLQLAYDIGCEIAARGAVLVCGGARRRDGGGGARGA